MRAQSKVYEEVSKAYKDTNVRVENIGDSVRARRIIDGTFEGRNIIFTLEQKGFLKRIENPNDRRSFQLVPTQDAIALVERIIPLSQAFNAQLTQGFSEEETKMLIALLNKVHHNLEGKSVC